MRNIKNVVMHELIGLQCEVVGAQNKRHVGLRGRIIDETMKTVSVDGKQVFKKGSVFRIVIDDKKADIDGDCLVGRPEDRIKKKIKKW